MTDSELTLSPEDRLESAWCRKSGIDITGYDNTFIESNHEWIQKAFPTLYGSRTYEFMPGLDGAAVERIKAVNPDVQGIMEANTERYLDYLESHPECLAEGNHNRKRITRIVESLVYFGFTETADYFLDMLRRIDSRHGKRIPNEMFTEWQQNASCVKKRP